MYISCEQFEQCKTCLPETDINLMLQAACFGCTVHLQVYLACKLPLGVVIKKQRTSQNLYCNKFLE